MSIIAGSPYAPDAASDWWNFAVNALIGIATLAALATSIWQARKASAGAKRAEAVAQSAVDREQAREAAHRQDALVARAARQATAVTASTKTTREGEEFSVEIVVANDSDLPIRNVNVFARGAGDRELRWLVGKVLPQSKDYSFLPMTLGGEELDPANASLTIEITDAYLDRWRIGPNSRITLIGSAEVTVETPGSVH